MRPKSIFFVVLLAVAFALAYAKQLQKLGQAVLHLSLMPTPTPVAILNSPYLLATLFGLLLQMVIVLVLVTAWLRTRNVGFVWLGMAVEVWPFVSGFIGIGQRILLDRVAHRQTLLFRLVERGDLTMRELISYLHLIGTVQATVGACLLLVAVLHLARARGELVTA